MKISDIFLIIVIIVYMYFLLDSFKGLIKLPKLNLTNMKTKYLFQALRFACLPTLSVLMLLFFGFFSISKTLEFISSNDGLAIAIRVLLFIAEVGLILSMYDYYKKIGEREEVLGSGEKSGVGINVSSRTYVHDIGHWSYDDKFIMYATTNKDMVLIERISKK